MEWTWVLGDLRPGEIVGSALMLSGNRAETGAVAVDATRTLRWEIATLQHYLEGHPETRIAFQRHLARDLGGKLTRVIKDAHNAVE